MLWLYDLPLWLLGCGVVGLSLVLAWASCLMCRRFGWVIQADAQGPSGLLHQFVGVLYAVALGLMVVQVQGAYSAVEQAVMEEASATTNLYRLAGGLEEPERTRLRQKLVAYLDSVIKVEWPAQRNARESEQTWMVMDGITDEIANYRPTSPHDALVLPEVLSQVNSLLDRRRERLFLGQQGIGTVIWTVILLGGVITIGFASAFELPSQRIHLAVTALMATMFGLMVFIIVAMDHPLWGDVSVGPDAFTKVRTHIALTGMRGS